MPRFIVPAKAGPYKVLTARAGNPLVCNNYKGKRQVLIPCKTYEQAAELCKQLNEGKNGDVFV
jgi:hypothetical protein